MAKKKKTINYEELITRINTRRGELAKAAKNLKKKFVGIDHIIDSVIENINIWYIMPELITRPVIINLWGMTGVGKTDLVRTLVRELSYTDRFLEIQLTNKSDLYYNSIQQYLANSSIDFDTPGIVLFDEMQRFRTVDQQGNEIHDCKYQDLWMLLSDGQFSNNAQSKEDLLEMLYNGRYYDQFNDDEPDDDDLSSDDRKERATEKRKMKKRQYHQSFYSASHLKKKLKLSEGVDEIMKWDESKKFAMIWSALKDDSVFCGDSYNKLLIFVSGNLDEAYEMASHAGDADNDADVFHEFSTKINLIDIKDALLFRFKPEQISRFGNTHVIYPSLARKSYEEIIRRRIRDIIANVKKQHGIKIKVDKSVHKCIYRNGVFPAQGVRPVDSTIRSMLGNALPVFILDAIEKRLSEISLRYEEGSIVAICGGSETEYPIECVIDNIKDEQTEDAKTLTSVHEAAHAVVYADIFGVVPTQIVSSMASSDMGGFVGLHNLSNSRKDILDKVAVYLAGQVGEEYVFGRDNMTNGASSDIDEASQIVSLFVRRWSMTSHIGVLKNPHGCQGPDTNFDIEATNQETEDIMKEARIRAKEILIKRISFFYKIVDELVISGKMKPDVFQQFASKCGMKLQVVAPRLIISHGYANQYTKTKDDDHKKETQHSDKVFEIGEDTRINSLNRKKRVAAAKKNNEQK